MSTLDKPCKRCGVMLYGVTKQRQYCEECGTLSRIEKRAKIPYKSGPVTKPAINKKWLVRGKVSNLSQHDTISNGSS